MKTYSPLTLCLVLVPLLPISSFSASQAAPSAVVVKQFSEIPVDMATGEFIQREKADLRIKSRGLMLEVSRNYRSRRESRGVFGYGWDWNHGEHLEFPGDFVIHYVSPEGVTPIIPDVSYTGAYARVCYAAPSWSQGGKATGLPDAIGGYGNVAHYYGPIASMQTLVVGGWAFSPPAGPSTILQVDLASIGATAYDADHPQYGATVKLSAGGPNAVLWGHRAYDFDYVNITSDRASWTWADVNAVQARLGLASYIINAPMDVIADTFHLGVTYTKNTSGEYKYLPGTTFELVRTNNEYWIHHKNRTHLVFAPDGRLLRRADANGNVLTYHYDEIARLKSIADALGQSITVGYDTGLAGARIVRLEDHLGRSVGFAYAGEDLVAVTNVLGHVTRYTYAEGESREELRHNLTRRVDPEGGTIGVAYYCTNSMSDRVRLYQDGEVTGGHTNEVDYLYLKGTTYSWRPGSGWIQGVVYNASNDISQVYIREGELTYQESDGINLMASHGAERVDSPTTSAWQNIESALGATNGLMAHNPGLGTNSALAVAGWGFSVPGMSNDIVGVVLYVRGMATNPVCLSVAGVASTNWVSSNATWVAWDISRARGRWTWAELSNLTAEISLPAGATNPVPVWIDGFNLKVSYRHFDPGQDPQDLLYFYDLSHNMVSSDRGGCVHQFAYDNACNLVAWTDAENHTRRYAYDPVFNKPTRTWDALGAETSMDYDSAGRLVRTTDALGNVSTVGYDAYGNVIRTTDADGGVEETFYDGNGLNVVRSRNRRGYETVYESDAYGNCTRITAPDGGRRHAVFNMGGLKISERDEAGVETRYEYDANDRLTLIIRAAGTGEETSERRRYDGRGLETERQDALGRVVRSDFDAEGRPYCRTDRLGGQTVTEYDENGNPWRLTDAAGQSSEAFRDERGNITLSYDRRGSGSSTAYDRNNNPVMVNDKSGNRVITRYDANGNKVGETFYWAGYPGCPESQWPRPLQVDYAYDALNRVTNTIVGVGNRDVRCTTRCYNAAGQVIRETDPAGNVRLTEYDAGGNVTHSCLRDEAGRIVEWEKAEYDSADRRVMEIKGGVATNRFEYDQRGLKIASIDPRGHRTTYAYDRHRRLVMTVTPDGTPHRLAYDQAGNKVREVNGDGVVTGYEWDAEGRLTRKISGLGLPDARTNSYHYDSLGRLLSVVDPCGTRTFTTYDAEGNITSETNGLGLAKTYGYDAAGRVTNTVDEMGGQVIQWRDGRGKLCRLRDQRGGWTTSRYDDYGRQVSVRDALGYEVSFGYDVRDNKILESDPRGVVTRYAYDAAGRVTNKIAGVGLAGAVVTTTSYDRAGRVVNSMMGGVSNQAVASEGRAYDPSGNLLAVTGACGAVTCYEYDVMDRQTQERDACGGVTRTLYDNRGNVIARVDALGAITRFSYDRYGLKKSQTEAGGGTARFEYDRIGRLTNTVDAAGANEARHYDAGDHLVTLRSRNGAVSVFKYDSLGRLTNTLDACGYQTKRAYDASGNILAETDGRGGVTRYEYDALNRVVSITDPASNTLFITCDPSGNKVREVFPLGLVVTYGYDGLGRLVLKTVGAGRPDARRTRYERDYAGRVVAEWNSYGQVVRSDYDGNGNKTNEVDRRGNQTQFQYDALNRLIRTVDALGRSSSVEYDALGRIVRSVNRRGGVMLHRYDAEGHLIELQDAEGYVKRSRYDVLGRLSEECEPNGLQRQFAYDAAGQLTNRTSLAPGGEKRCESYQYDLLGRKARERNAGGIETAYVRDGNGNVVTESVFNASGALLRTKNFQYDSRNQVVAEVGYRGEIRRNEFDAIGRKVASIDPLGNRTTYEWNPYSEQVATTDPAGNRSIVTYDLCGREVERVNALGQRTRFQYDPNGNRTAEVDDNGKAVLKEYDLLNRISRLFLAKPDASSEVLRRADFNGDGQVNDADVASLEGALQ